MPCTRSTRKVTDHRQRVASGARAALLLVALSAVARPAPAEDAASIIELICGRTVHFFDASSGNQIEYTAADGSAYLWHSQADAIIIGTWEVTQITLDSGEVCYRYEPGSFSATDPGSEFCFDYGGLVIDIASAGVREGDPYGLATGEMPFPLPLDTPVSVARLREIYPDQPPERACGLLMM